MIRSTIFCAALGLMAANSHAAQIVFTVQATVTSSNSSGFAVNDPLIITFTTSPVTSSLTASGPDFDWFEDSTAEPVFSDITVTGLSGSWTRPVDPQTGITLSSSSDDFFALYSHALNGTEMGLSVGSDPVKNIMIQAFFSTSPFDYGSANQKTDYFADYEGTYVLTPPSSPATYSSIDFASGDLVTFNATSLNITVIPEPSALLTLACGSIMMAARRRISR